MKRAQNGAYTLFLGQARTSRLVVVSVANRLIHIHVAVPDLYVETARRIRAYPRFEVDRSPAAAKVGKWYEVTDLALLALRQYSIHPISLQPWPRALPHACQHHPRRLFSSFRSHLLSIPDTPSDRIPYAFGPPPSGRPASRIG